MEEYPARKLAVILHADVVSSTELVQLNESLAHQRIQDTFRRFSATISNHSGIAHEIRGDALVAEFARASDAVGASLAFQAANATHNEALPDEIQPVMRVGIAIGEVVVADHTVTGEGVVLAQRLEQISEPGGVCIQGAAYETVPKRLPFDYRSMGEKTLKGFEEPVRAYSVLLKPGEDIPVPEAGDLHETPSVEWPDKPSIAVLPFINMSGDPEQEYFSDGISEEITTALTNMGWFSVTARHSTLVYKSKAIDLRQVGKELGVRYILEGSVRKGGAKVRVTAQLIDTETGKHIWASHYDGTLEDIFDFQDQITETIVGTLEPEFQRAEAERIGYMRPDSMEAYDYLLRGLSYMDKATSEDTQTALRFFYKAIEKDPGYGRAYAYAFWCYRRVVDMRGLTLSEKEQTEAVRLMQAGLQADKEDHVVLWQASTMKCLFHRDFQGALALIDRSFAINPNSPRTWYASALVHTCLGDTETAIDHAERAIRISPRNPARWYARWCIAAAHLQELRYEKAAEAAKQALQLNNDMVLACLILAASCAHLGQVDEVQAATKQALELDPELTISRVLEIYPIAKYKNLDAFIDGLRKAGLPE